MLGMLISRGSEIYLCIGTHFLRCIRRYIFIITVVMRMHGMLYFHMGRLTQADMVCGIYVNLCIGIHFWKVHRA